MVPDGKLSVRRSERVVLLEEGALDMPTRNIRSCCGEGWYVSHMHYSGV